MNYGIYPSHCTQNLKILATGGYGHAKASKSDNPETVAMLRYKDQLTDEESGNKDEKETAASLGFNPYNTLLSVGNDLVMIRVGCTVAIHLCH